MRPLFSREMRNGLNKIGEERDESAFRSLFLTFGPKVRAMLLKQGADAATAEDIVQDTMLAVWSKSHLFEENKGTFASWIYAIARNLRTDRVRRQVVWERLRDDLARYYCSEPVEHAAARTDQERQDIGEALGGLPPEQLQVVRLSFIEGLSQVEIADSLKLPLGTVKSRMRLAVQKLRCSVEDDDA